MSIRSYYPTTRPSYVINFSKKTLLNSGVRFTRGGGGTYVDENGLIVSAIPDQPRFNHNPETLEYEGLLVEAAVTNRVLRSEEFDYIYWTTTNATVTANAITSPAGSATADLLTENTSLGIHKIKSQLIYASIPGVLYTHSFYVKPNGRNEIGIRYNDSGLTIFNLITKQITVAEQLNAGGQIVSNRIETLPSGWYRISSTISNPTNYSRATEVQLINNGATSYQGNGTSGVYIWGAQVESSPYPTSYIPTSGSTVTRPADLISVCSVSGVKSGRIKFSSATSNSYLPYFTLKDSALPAKPYALELGSVNSAPVASVVYNLVRQGTTSIPSVPGTGVPSESTLSFNFEPTTGSVEISSTASDDADSHVLSLPAELSRPLPSDQTLNLLSVEGKSFPLSLKEIYLWETALTIDQLASVSSELRSIGQPVEASTGLNENSDYADVGARPTLDLRFAERKDLFDDTTEQNLVTFSRASKATYFNEDGILVYDQSLNLLSYSEQFNTSPWFAGTLEPFGSGSVINAINSPFGEQTADKIVWQNAQTNGGYVRQSSSDRGVGNNPIVQFRLDGTNTITPSGVLPADVYNIIPVGNDGWYRCYLYDSVANQTLSVYAKAGEFDTVQLQFYSSFRYIYVRDSVATQGDGVSGIYLWGAQLEEGIGPSTYIPTTNGVSGSPRFDHDPETGESLGLLVEESRTNYVKNSPFFIGWTQRTAGATTLIPNQIIAPDGTLTASKLVLNSGVVSGYQKGLKYVAAGLPTGSYATITLFVKAGEYTEFCINHQRDNDIRVQYDLVQGTYTKIGGNTADLASITPVGNGWWKCTSTRTGNNNNTWWIQPGPENGGTVTGDGTSGIYIWGPQYESGSFPTSYIPTPATFTSRASIATYYDATGTIQTAQTDVARDNAYFPDENGVMKPAGLLLEAARTNYIKSSSDTSNTASWVNNGVTTTPNQSSPDGQSNATLIRQDTSDSTHSIDVGKSSNNLNNYYIYLTQGSIYTCSVFVKKFNSDRITIAGNRFIGFGSPGYTSAGVVFDFSTESIIKTINWGNSAFDQLTGVDVDKYADGWYRVSYSFRVGTDPNARIIDLAIYPHEVSTVLGAPVAIPSGAFGISGANYGANSISSFTGDGSTGVYIWGAQIEDSPYATSYIPTAGSQVTRAADVSSSATVTRNADVVQITGTNFSSWYNQSEGTTFVHLKNIKSQNFSLAPFIAYDGNNNMWDSNQEYGLRYNSSGTTMEAVIRDSSAGTVSLTRGGDVRTETKAVIALNSTQFALTRDGGSVSTVATLGPISSITRFTLNTTSGPRQSTRFSRLTYWPIRLPDTTLQVLTDPAISTWDLIFDSSLSTNGTCAVITASTCTYTIDWGDGTPVQTVNATGTGFEVTHRYTFPQTYKAKIKVLSGAFKPYYNNSAYADQLLEISQTPDGWTNTATSGFGTDLQNAWYGANNLTVVDRELNTSGVTNFFTTWRDCSSLTSFPLIDTSSGTNFLQAWYNCSSLTSFPLIDTSSGTSFGFAWYNCLSLTSFPLINTSSGTYFGSAWQYCPSLTSFPLIDTSSGTSFNSSWSGCSSLTSFPANFFDAWTGTPANNCFLNAWDNCSSLTPTSVENILNSIDTSGQSAPASGVDITITYNASSGTPNVLTAVTNLKSRGWTITLNGVLQ